ncbi:carbohydrate ABC transporter permease [Lacrimispora sp.]|uniref:carbohydrate ABC transporter permease n=1 Tax=Lacrimispora sp. TaxID=2719234 RepID=UPI00285BA314|nr:sugar ABC transporter permease [Lacrimispora sp.]MDR7813936.1 sugar ABC transporter permease [Lacrimispora sp.]
MAVFMAYPLLRVFVLSLQRNNPSKPYLNGFVGLGNFIELFHTSQFYQALANSFKWVILEVVLQLVFGMAIALLLNKKFKGRGLVRTLTFIPWALSGVLTAVIWSLIYNQHMGVLNDMLMRTGWIDKGIAWTGNRGVVFGAVALAELWRGIPFFAITLLAAMQNISGELYEAANVDGSNAIQKLLYITLPLLKETIVLTTLLRAVWEFNSVDLIYSLTGGGPAGMTTTLSMYIADQAIRTSNYGYGSSISVVSFLILSIFAIIYMKCTNFGKDN